MTVKFIFFCMCVCACMRACVCVKHTWVFLPIKRAQLFSSFVFADNRWSQFAFQAANHRSTGGSRTGKQEHRFLDNPHGWKRWWGTDQKVKSLFHLCSTRYEPLVGCSRWALSMMLWLDHSQFESHKLRSQIDWLTWSRFAYPRAFGRRKWYIPACIWDIDDFVKDGDGLRSWTFSRTIDL